MGSAGARSELRGPLCDSPSALVGPAQDPEGHCKFWAPGKKQNPDPTFVSLPVLRRPELRNSRASSFWNITKSPCTKAPDTPHPPGASGSTPARSGEQCSRWSGTGPGAAGRGGPPPSVHELSVALGPGDDDIHPDAHGFCRRGHHVVQPVVGLHAEGEGWVWALPWEEDGLRQGPRVSCLPTALAPPSSGHPGARG